MSRAAMLTFLVLGACGSNLVASAPDAEVASPAAPVLPDTLEAGKLEEVSSKRALVPSPLETQKVLADAGIEADLATLMKDRTVDAAGTNEDQTAIATGVVLADMLLSIKVSTDERLLAQLAQIHNGMVALKGGDDIVRTIADISERVKAKAVNRENLLKELDELSGAVIPELEFEGRTRIVPLIQGGSWLEGANLVASASKAAGKTTACDQLLKQPDVVAYFQERTRRLAGDTAVNPVYDSLGKALARLHELSTKVEPLNSAEVDDVIALTGGLLSVL